MMTLTLINIMFWGFWLWRIFGGFLGLLTKKERYCIDCITDALLALSNTLASILDFGPICFLTIPFAIFFVFAFRRDYRRWKNTDDDDDWKARRKSWAKSKLPRPLTKNHETIPQPI